MFLLCCLVSGLLWLFSTAVVAESPPWDTEALTHINRDRNDAALMSYFDDQVTTIEQATRQKLAGLDDWKTFHAAHREQLLDMLGLDPLPARTALNGTVVGTSEKDGVVVERLHFQSSPGLYVTGNLFRPSDTADPLPAILYVCGHGREMDGDRSLGNKVHYQHHGVWFAKHGYVCLLIDTIQLGEIMGYHHGTYRHNLRWWASRGYTPAGVEAWNSIRALDYLASRPDVDADRMGVTGRSGGGAYSWWLAAIDDRVQVAVPVAGITSLRNHVVDGVIEGHCDCMYFHNTRRWDFPLVSSLVAPRPLLISNTDKDTIFPLDGVIEIHRQTRQIYDQLQVAANLGLQITEGPHSDTQELRIHAFRWMNRFLRNEHGLITIAAEPLFERTELRVFNQLPTDEIVTKIHEEFVPPAVNELPADQDAWLAQRDEWREKLRQRTFHGWPADQEDLAIRHVGHRDTDAGTWEAYQFSSQSHVTLPLFLWSPNKSDTACRIEIVDADAWPQLAALLEGNDPANLPQQRTAWVIPRGIGPTDWTADDRERTHIRRRFQLIGQTLDGMRVWDVRRGLAALRSLADIGDATSLIGSGPMAGVALYASLYSDPIDIELHHLPRSHMEGPILMSVLRTLDVPQAVAMAAERSRVTLRGVNSADWEYPLAVQETLEWPRDRLQIHP
ncbi:MAG: acetylxylan esterase [Planctomycetales bacterium]|nr:acetylxylan esterase [Planctomycetales bacterium]